MRPNWRKFIERTILAAAVAFVLAVVPLPVWTPAWFLYWQVPIAVLIFIIYIGTLLIDTIVFPKK